MLLGITGVMGSGKSTALAVFKELGFHIIDCDQLVAQLLSSNRPLAAQLAGYFGSSCLLADGSVSKQVLSAKLAADPDGFAFLEKCLHPLVRKAWMAAVSERPEVNWAVEVPLLFENKLEKYFDFTLCISSSAQTRVRRLASRGLSPKEQVVRNERQFSLEEKERLADFVILGDGSVDFLRAQIQSALEKIQA